MSSGSWYGILGLAGLLSCVAPGWAQTVYEGRVIAVDDGDTLTLRTRTGVRLKIRLAEIDAPELAQSHGNRARQGLAHLTLDRAARVVEQTMDRYGRVVGRVTVDDLDVSAELLRLGLAWSYRQYAQDSALYRLEQQAREARRGLWADPRPIPPWTFRHGETPLSEHRTVTVHRCERADGTVVFSQTACGIEGETRYIELGSSVRRRIPVAKTDGRSNHERLCSRKPTCDTLRDCDEARFFFVVCRFAYLDHNGDGTPCDRLCR